jgi:hypothetical protein
MAAQSEPGIEKRSLGLTYANRKHKKAHPRASLIFSLHQNLYSVDTWIITIYTSSAITTSNFI